jgi:hypothetical protein
VSANAIGGTAPYSYKFWVFNGSSWTVGRDWGASATWAWIPPAAGTYTVQVWARNAGSTALYDAWLSSVPLTVTGTAPLVVTRLWLITDPPSLQVPLVWSAAATGGTAPYTYRFLYHDGTSWSVGQDWSPSLSGSGVRRPPGGTTSRYGSATPDRRHSTMHGLAPS